MLSYSPRHRAEPDRRRANLGAAPTAEQATTPASPEVALGRRLMPVGALAAWAVTAASPALADNPAEGRVLAGLPAEDRFLVQRLSYGLNGRMVAQVRRMGGARAWLDQQLSPETIADPAGDEVDTWYPSLSLSPQQLWAKSRATDSMGNTKLSDDLSRWTLMRRAYSSRQVHEVMTEFWSNLLHIPAPMDKCWPHRTGYDRTIRANALGRFDDLLEAAVLHPAMLLYLDNYESTKEAPNENLGREVLECHTVGRGANYSEAEVLDSTRILTGWAVDRLRTWDPSYNADGHYRGPVKVLDFTDANANANGVQVAKDYLRYLAHHPATATRVATKLATRFVSDRPPAALIADVAAAFRSSGTDIKATMLALVNHPDFVGASLDKVRTPTEDFLATVRALRVQAMRPRNDSDLASYCVWMTTIVGQRPFDWPSPDGMPDAGEAWSSTTRMLGSWTMHNTLAAKAIAGAEYCDDEVWLPTLPATFEDIVIHASRRILYEDPSPTLMAACCESVGQRRNDVITRKTQFIQGKRLALLLSCMLDSPSHMKR